MSMPDISLKCDQCDLAGLVRGGPLDVAYMIENIEVPVYNPAKTIVDCFRYRNKIGLDLALEGLREGLRRRCCTPDQLWRYAQTARVWSVMRPYVEALVADG